MLSHLKSQTAIKALLLGLVISLMPLNIPARAQRVRLPQKLSHWSQQVESFGKVPRLTSSGSTYQTPNTPSTYYFTILVPQDARDALKAVTIDQKSGPEKITLAVDRSRAVLGSDLASGSPLALTPIGGSEPQEANEVTVVFDKPIQLGRSVTLGVRVRANPNLDGIYSFGVTAFPDQERSPALYLGSATLDFTSNN
jgi:hypothetical protein